MRAAHDLDDSTLAELARMSLRASRAPSDVLQKALDGVDEWLRADSRA
jgi:adenosine deaminase